MSSSSSPCFSCLEWSPELPLDIPEHPGGRGHRCYQEPAEASERLWRRQRWRVDSRPPNQSPGGGTFRCEKLPCPVRSTPARGPRARRALVTLSPKPPAALGPRRPLRREVGPAGPSLLASGTLRTRTRTQTRTQTPRPGGPRPQAPRTHQAALRASPGTWTSGGDGDVDVMEVEAEMLAVVKTMVVVMQVEMR
ncbi:translation initiation factor IF-2-like isoform X3 [Canis lupus familiaris]|uniref:translation initiation factor IF-2-like isoform X3 n=1 Tax=Canis lupus familiaris TaxID=9615 RepID=UPI0018F37774|nr:translation initiation factor IF-2-like isoform X3 [Canis lupus familiaris]